MGSLCENGHQSPYVDLWIARWARSKHCARNYRGLVCALRLRGSHRDRATLGGALVTSSYAFMAGFAVPSQRGVMMLAVLAITFLSRRRTEPLRILASVAMLVLVLDLVSLMKPGFALLFGAVVVLLRTTHVY
jgi:predicted membrane metal-binding protein